MHRKVHNHMIRAVYPGSFDPFHMGHLDIAVRASTLFDELYVAVYDKPSKRLLFSAEERANLVKEALADVNNVSVVTYTGLTVDCARRLQAQVIVRGLRNLADFQKEHQEGWANKHLAPDIELCCLFCSRQYAYLSASILKEVASLGGDYSEWALPHVQDALRAKFTHIDEPSTNAASATIRSDGTLPFRR